ncbi:hypothetical protein P170DRAFT_247104 [Aspergillus steynii IBT 23096]|uniref:Secreted protein n=1 Tax=Aspergillus steynii IBT 23096 TaxID=1392250 RepID=A0A2I2FY89_9EURO|nr:uncharacterized protein P170DRAFT_247104 [Aspergillus steynii IBT 23096]PLB45599.1 hypothetical protein P170DRAFT_247104 [Aspergillus steynii IBT 23096]
MKRISYSQLIKSILVFLSSSIFSSMSPCPCPKSIVIPPVHPLIVFPFLSFPLFSSPNRPIKPASPDALLGLNFFMIFIRGVRVPNERGGR